MTEEHCAKCKTPTLPMDEPVVVKKIRARMRLLRYECSKCNWVWANELQRKLNEHEYNKTFELLNIPDGWA
jgi:transposase-like protein